MPVTILGLAGHDMLSTSHALVDHVHMPNLGGNMRDHGIGRLWLDEKHMLVAQEHGGKPEAT